jgi:SAM-dependent methyltransferase
MGPPPCETLHLVTESKPELYSAHYAEWFKDPDVIAAYPSRPRYAETAFTLLAELAVDQPRRVLDIGCGTGDIARRLAPLVDSVDAVDFSSGMIEIGRRLPGGDAANLRWTLSPVETFPLESQYALVTAGESLHWMDWSVVMPRFWQALSPNGVVAMINRDWEGPTAVRERIRPVLMRYSPVPWQNVSLLAELEERGLFRQVGSKQFEPQVWQPTIDEYLESRHSQRSFARTLMGAEAAAAFDKDMRATLDALCAEGIVTRVGERLQLPVTTTVVWGRPAARPTA